MFGLNPWVLLAIIVSVGAVLGGTYMKGHIDGNNSCTSSYEDAAQALEDKSNLEIEEIKQTTKERVDYVKNSPKSDDAPASPGLKRTLDGLRERHSSSKK